MNKSMESIDKIRQIDWLNNANNNKTPLSLWA